VSTTSVDVAWLEWLAETAGAKVEVDIEGSIIVTPATDEHFVAGAEFLRQLGAVAPEGVLVGAEGPRWAPLGADRPSKAGTPTSPAEHRPTGRSSCPDC
jgi:hypothetical protein